MSCAVVYLSCVPAGYDSELSYNRETAKLRLITYPVTGLEKCKKIKALLADPCLCLNFAHTGFISRFSLSLRGYEVMWRFLWLSCYGPICNSYIELFVAGVVWTLMEKKLKLRPSKHKKHNKKGSMWHGCICIHFGNNSGGKAYENGKCYFASALLVVFWNRRFGFIAWEDST